MLYTERYYNLDKFWNDLGAMNNEQTHAVLLSLFMTSTENCNT